MGQSARVADRRIFGQVEIFRRYRSRFDLVHFGLSWAHVRPAMREKAEPEPTGEVQRQPDEELLSHRQIMAYSHAYRGVMARGRVRFFAEWFCEFPLWPQWDQDADDFIREKEFPADLVERLRK